MGLWKRICCCVQDNEIEVDENTRLLPISSAEGKIKKVESPFMMYSFGVTPPGLHLKLIHADFTKLGISKIACGAEHILMLSETNFVIAAGNNEYGQCARDPDQPLDPQPNEAEEKNESPKNLRMTAFNIDKFRILDIAAGAYHSMVLVSAENTYNNSSYAKAMVWGHPLGCGFVDNSGKFIPTEVPVENLKENITGVFAGQMRSGLITETGKVFVWGEWFTGTKQCKPKELIIPFPCKKLAIGKMFISALTNVGKVFSVGDNTYGELGIGRDIRTTLKFTEVNLPSQVTDIAAGARHSLFLTRDSKLYACGDNSEGQCGLDVTRTYSPVEIPLKVILNNSHVERIFSGEAHSGFLTTDGELFCWGDNTAGRLGFKGSMSVFRPRIVEDTMGKYISGIGMGGLFTAILIGPSGHSLLKRAQVSEQLIPPS